MSNAKTFVEFLQKLELTRLKENAGQALGLMFNKQHSYKTNSISIQVVMSSTGGSDNFRSVITKNPNSILRAI